MKFKTMDDIEREKQKENRIKMRDEISEDINEVIGNVFGKPEKKKKKGFFSWIWFFIKILGGLFLIVILADILLGSVWLLKFFAKSLFFGG